MNQESPLDKRDRMAAKPAPGTVWRCPKCHGDLQHNAGQLACSACGLTTKMDAGIAMFEEKSNTHGELTPQETQAFVTDIQNKGLKDALAQLDASHRPRITRLILAPGRANILTLTDPDYRGRILDFGCGYGGVSRQLAKAFDEVYALDGSSHRLHVLSAIMRDAGIENVVPVFQQDVLNLPFQDGSLDAVVLVGVFEYLPLGIRDAPVHDVHDRCLAEFRRVLKPGGRLIIGTHNRFGWRYLLGGKDHGGYRFRQILPGPIERLVAKLKGRPERRLTYHTPAGLTQLASRRFSKVTAYWPWPSYQIPEVLLPLDSEPRQLENFVAQKYGGRRRLVFQVLAKLGLMPRLVPSFYVVCEAN